MVESRESRDVGVEETAAYPLLTHEYVSRLGVVVHQASDQIENGRWNHVSSKHLHQSGALRLRIERGSACSCESIDVGAGEEGYLSDQWGRAFQ